MPNLFLLLDTKLILVKCQKQENSQLFKSIIDTFIQNRKHLKFYD